MVLLWLLPLTPSENVLKWFGYKKTFRNGVPYIHYVWMKKNTLHYLQLAQNHLL